MKCKVATDLKYLKDSTKNISWSIVSGGDQEEIRYILKKRKIDFYFDGGIFGSPSTKEDIFKREFKKGTFQYPALYIGDSKYDHIASSKFYIDFIFLSVWTEFKNWEKYSSKRNIPTIKKLSNLLDMKN